ncbi:M23 family metallopeptidase [candidate division CSSED10-310 bacterium]|uniref:M23 family metallopeptidase n=1 Tax=candidate division CSSED10-310 bacterium TaxID=2855610 RepID=A0ABV6Z4B6_UNCC1
MIQNQAFGKVMQKTVFIISVVSLFLSPVYAAQSLQWPLAVNYGISATFGEFRYGHFHAGIDLRTAGKNGFQVLAADSGHIYRLNIRKRGYGKAIYIRHQNDLITVYGHLERFEEKQLHLESYLAEKQITLGKYPGNLYLNIPIRKGQCIGFSGESGAGLPHLHFEVRQGEERPINPFRAGFRVLDKKGPLIRKIIFTPRSADSYINHYPRDYILSTANIRKLTPPVIRGQIEVSIDAYDVLGALNRVNIYSALIKFGAALLNEVRFDEITYTQNHRSGLIYNLASSGFSPTRYVYQLGHRYGRELPFGQDFAAGSGIIDTKLYPEGTHNIQVQVADFAGNLKTITIPVTIDNTITDLRRAEIQNKNREQPSQLKQCKIRDHHNYLSIIGEVINSHSRFPQVSVSVPGKGGVRNIELMCPDRNIFVGTLDMTTLPCGELKILFSDPFSPAQIVQQNSYVIRRFKPGKGGRLETTDFYVDIPQKALFEDLYLTYEAFKPPRHGALKAVGSAISLRPPGVPFDQSVLIGVYYALDQSRDPAKLGVYVLNEYNKRWAYRSPSQHLISKALLEVKISSLAGFCLFYDDVPPAISAPSSFKPDALREGEIIILKVYDEGMGIDDARTKVRVAEIEIDNEYDPDRGWLKIFLPLGLNKGTFQMSVTVFDRGGNKSKPFQRMITVI